MEILNQLLCQYCQKEKALGLFRNKWSCGKCMLKFEDKIQQLQNRQLDIIEQEIREENGNYQ